MPLVEVTRGSAGARLWTALAVFGQDAHVHVHLATCAGRRLVAWLWPPPRPQQQRRR